MCGTCRTMRDQDALAIATIEIAKTFHNPCAPVSQFTCRCKTCGTRWLAIEVYDESNTRPSAWSWERITGAET